MLTIIDYGMGNVGSIKNMLNKVGVTSKISSDIEEIKKSEKVILPGVGSFDTAIRRIDELGLRQIIVDLATIKKIPVLGICLGMQLLMEKSEEGTLNGLGLIKGESLHFKNRISPELKIPHMGWNIVHINNPTELTKDFSDEMRFYFVHSYFVKVANPENSMLKCHYGIDFDAAVNFDNIYGAQFHPEKSHQFGIKFFANFAKL